METVLLPCDPVIALRFARTFPNGIWRRFFYKDADPMLPAAIDKRCHGAASDHVEPSALEGKSARGKVVHRWSEIELAVKPRFDGVLIGRCNVHQMARLQRAQVRVYGGDDGNLAIGLLFAQPHLTPGQRGCEQNRGGDRKPAPPAEPEVLLCARSGQTLLNTQL